MSKPKRKYYRKHVELFSLIEKIKLWPSRAGILHGVRSIKVKGNYAEVTTHCGKSFLIYNSRSSRAARWLRNKWVRETCKECKIPAWKLEKYSMTCFTEHYGTDLRQVKKEGQLSSYPNVTQS